MSDAVSEDEVMSLLEVGLNSRCSDCHIQLATDAFVSRDFFIFLCPRCAGIHRRIGTSVVCELTELTEDDTVTLAGGGNARFNAEYEAKLELNFKRHGQGDENTAAAEEFIRMKYEKQVYREIQPLSPTVHVFSRDIDSLEHSRESSANMMEEKAAEVATRVLGPNSTVVVAILVVGFDERYGNVIEWTYPTMEVLPQEFEHVPFLALPDGAHGKDEDVSYFILPPRTDSATSVYGVSCFKQINGDSVSRGRIQKAVCLISRVPLWGAIHVRLLAATRAYFEQENFNDFDVLIDTHDSFSSLLNRTVSEPDLFMGVSPSKFLKRFKRGALTLFKAVLLEKRVLIHGIPAFDAVSSVISLLSLLPGQLEALIPEKWIDESSHEHLNDPLLVFGNATDTARHKKEVPTLQPYMAVSQLPELRNGVVSGHQSDRRKGFLVGASNALFAYEPAQLVEVVGSIATGKVIIQDKEAALVLSYTSADTNFIDWMIAAIDKRKQNDTAWVGSDSWIRAQFARYCQGLRESSMTGSGLTGGGGGYGEAFIGLWRTTLNFKQYCEAKQKDLLIQHPGRDIDTLENIKVQLGPALEAADRFRAQADTQFRAFGDTVEKALSNTGSSLGMFQKRVTQATKDVKGSISSLMNREKGENSNENGKNNSGKTVGNLFSSLSSGMSNLFGRSRSLGARNVPTNDVSDVVEVAEKKEEEKEEKKEDVQVEEEEEQPEIKDGVQIGDTLIDDVDPSAFTIDDDDEIDDLEIMKGAFQP